MNPGPELLKKDTRVHRAFAPHVAAMTGDERRAWLLDRKILPWPEYGGHERETRDLGLDNLAANMRFAEAFRRAAEAIAVPVMPVKGIFLLDNLYRDNWNLRRGRDADILIRPGDFSIAVKNLARAGYRIEHGWQRAPIGYHVRAFGPDGAMVSVQLRYTFHLGATLDKLDPRPGECLGVECLVPSHEKHCHYLSWHLFKHVCANVGNQIKWADELFRIYESDPDAVMVAAGTKAARRRLRLLEILFAPPDEPVEPRGAL